MPMMKLMGILFIPLSALMRRAEEIVVEDGNKVNAFQWSIHFNNYEHLIVFRSPDSSVIIMTGYGLGSIPGIENIFFFPRVQTDSGNHPASYPMGTGKLFPPGSIGRGVKLTTHLHLVVRSRKVELYFSPSSWYNAQLINHRDKFTLTYTHRF
jgi:hypothetical protein